MRRARLVHAAERHPPRHRLLRSRIAKGAMEANRRRASRSDSKVEKKPSAMTLSYASPNRSHRRPHAGFAAALADARAEQDAEAEAVAGLARRFTALVRACGVGSRRRDNALAKPTAELDAWLVQARVCGVPAIETFAAGLGQDGTAVRAALTEPWSSGQAEGQVDRLQLLRRQSYGRAGIDLLRRRVLIAA